MVELELIAAAWVCTLLILLGIGTSMFRLSGAYSSKGPGTTDPDSMPAAIQRAHGNLAEWAGAFSTLCVLSSSIGLGRSGILADVAGYLAVIAAAGVTLHRASMIVFGQRQFHWSKMLGFSCFYLGMTFLAVRVMVSLATGASVGGFA